jgi:hypothetical protein
LAQILQIFLGKEHLVKNWLIYTLDKVIYFKGTIFQRSTKFVCIDQFLNFREANFFAIERKGNLTSDISFVDKNGLFWFFIVF